MPSEPNDGACHDHPDRSGRHFLQIPGPTNVPDRILRAIDRPTIDHRGPDFARLAGEILAAIRPIFKTEGPVVIYPASGTGAWEAALVNTLSPGDRVLMAETGHFASLWCEMARRLGLEVELLPGDWRHGVDPEQIEATLAADRAHRIKAICVVHNETSTGVTSRIAEVRRAIDQARHPGAVHGRHDLLARLDRLPPRRVGRRRHGRGLAEGPDAAARAQLQRAEREGDRRGEDGRGCRRSYWDWPPMLAANAKGVFPYTPATNLLYGLREALAMLHEQGLEQVFARHDRHAEATRRAVGAWGLEVLCQDPREYSSSLTAVLMPDGQDADALRRADPGALRSVARQRPRQARRAGCSGSAISAISTT